MSGTQSVVLDDPGQKILDSSLNQSFTLSMQNEQLKQSSDIKMSENKAMNLLLSSNKHQNSASLTNLRADSPSVFHPTQGQFSSKNQFQTMHKSQTQSKLLQKTSDGQTKPEHIQVNVMALKPMHMHTGSYSKSKIGDHVQDDTIAGRQEALLSYRTQQS